MSFLWDRETIIKDWETEKEQFTIFPKNLDCKYVNESEAYTFQRLFDQWNCKFGVRVKSNGLYLLCSSGVFTVLFVIFNHGIQ